MARNNGVHHVIVTLIVSMHWFVEAVFATLPKTVRGQPMIISGKQDKKTFLYTHGNSVYIRNIEVCWDY